MGSIYNKRKALLTRTPTRTPKKNIQIPDYEVDDETMNWDALPFNEEIETETEEFVPDYGIPAQDLEEDILPEEDPLREKAIPPDSEDETLPGEKQLPGPSTSASPPPYSPPYSPPSSPPPGYLKRRKKDPENVDLSTLKKFLRNNKGDPNAVFSTPKSKFVG